MKKILGLLVLMMVITGCQKVNKTGKVDGWKVIEVDGCEYLYGYEGYMGFMAHKGNCENH